MDIKEIGAQFSLVVKKAERVSHAILSEVYIINGTHVLRSRVLESGVIDRFKNECVLIDHIRSRVPIQFPSLISTKDGTNHLIIDKFLWTAYPLIQGDILCSWWELEKLSPEQEKNTFVTLKKLHTDTAGILSDVSDITQYHFLNDVRQRFSDPDPLLSEKEKKRIQQSIDYVVAREERFAESEKCFVHGDYHPGNTIFKGSKVVGLLDLDWSRKGYGIEDLAYTVMMFLRDYRLPKFLFKKEKLANYIKWYDLAREQVRDLHEYLILYTFYDVHLFDRLSSIPDPKKFRAFQRAFLNEICEQF
ncbi:MAG: aminoglycoside phosphotransferase family protein [Candidatus Pacebacteria bacterium]|nr:aminoglycoside phosphotransferase family protein [Candidatus Paceibacterota bacterium]